MRQFPRTYSGASLHLDRHVPLWHRHHALGRCRCHFTLIPRDLLRCSLRLWLAARAQVVVLEKSEWAAPEKANCVRRKAEQLRLSASGHVVTKKKGLSTGSCSRLRYRLREPSRPLGKNTQQSSRVACNPLCSRCVRFVVAGFTAVSQSETEAAALQQAKKKQQRSGGGRCPPAWLAENTERNKTIRKITFKKEDQRCLDENRPSRAPLKVRNCVFVPHVKG